MGFIHVYIMYLDHVHYFYLRLSPFNSCWSLSSQPAPLTRSRLLLSV